MNRWTVLTVAVLTLLAVDVARSAVPTIKGDPQAAQELQAAFQRFGAARSWRARMVAGAATTTTEYVAPDRFHMTVAEGTRSTEMFIIGRQIWVRSPAGCSKVPAAIPVMNLKEMAEHSAADTTITASRGGPEIVEGTPTQTYLLIVESKGTTVREKMYIVTGTGLPRRIEVQTERGPLVIDYFDFNTPITINDPPC